MIRLEKRAKTPWWLNIAVPLCCLAAALAISSLFLWLMKIQPMEALSEMAFSAFGDAYGFSETMTKAIPLAISATALILSYKMLVWNIGAEGQIMVGALAAVAVVRYFPLSSGWAMIGLMIAAGMALGALWGGIAGFLRAKWNVNEIITTLMLNYIAANLKNYYVYGPWRDPTSLGFPMTAAFPASAILSEVGFGRMHSMFWLMFVLPVVVWWVLKYTRWGFEIRVVGENPRAARFAGIDDLKNVVLVMMISGALCGLTGVTEMAGLQHRLQAGFSSAFGFTAIIVAWLANLNPLAVPLVAIGMGGLLVGGEALQIAMGLPVAGTQVIQGFILLAVIAGEFFKRYRLAFHKEARQ